MKKLLKSKKQAKGRKMQEGGRRSAGDRLSLKVCLLVCIFLSLVLATACQGGGETKEKPAEVSETGEPLVVEGSEETEQAEEDKETKAKEDEAEAGLNTEGEKQEADPVSDKLSGGRAIVGITQEPDFLDPHMAVAAGTKEILFNLFEGLVKMTPEGDFEPCLARSWTIEDEGKTYRFSLREGVLFHNGKELTAEDVVFSLSRAAGLGDEAALVPELKQITAVSEDKETGEILVRQKESDANLIAYLTTSIIPAGYTEQNSQPVGTGPFSFSRYTPQVSLEIERFEDYWGEPAYLEEVSFKIYGDMDAAYLELMAGQIDIFPYLTEEKTHGLEKQYEVVSGGANMIQLMALNNAVEPFTNPLVREAVNVALGREAICDLIMGDYGTPIFSGMAPSMGVFFNDALPGKLEADPQRAKELLAEAGYEEGLSFRISIPGNYLIHVDTGNVIAAQLAEAGIQAEIETVDWGTWLEKIYAGRDYEATIIALTYDYYTPSDVLDRYMSDASENFINFQNEEYDALVIRATQEQDKEKRIADYGRLQEILFEENASAFIQEPMNITVVRKALAGYTQYPAYVQDLSCVYYVDRAELDLSLQEP